MTLYGIDISNNNGGNIDLAQVAREGFSFVFAKVSEGSSFVDWTWPGYAAAARANGLKLAGYHYLRADADIEAQADLFLAHLGDAPAMVDFESGSGDLSTFWAFVNAVNARGRRISLSYIPRWYWQSIGSPDLSQVPGLIQSSYVAGNGFAATLYPGDGFGGWAPFGGAAPALLQFTDAAIVAGHVVDANAFRGSLAQLTTLLTGGHSMELTDQITNGVGASVPLSMMLSATDFHASMVTDAVFGPGSSAQVAEPFVPKGIPELGGRTLVGGIAAIAAHLGVSGCSDPGPVSA